MDARKRLPSIDRQSSVDENVPRNVNLLRRFSSLRRSGKGLTNYLDKVTDIRKSTERISGLVEELRVLQSDILCSPVVDVAKKEKIEELQYQIRALANKVRSQLKSLSPDPVRYTNRSAKGRIHQVQYDAITHSFMEVMEGYNELELKYYDQVKRRIKRQYSIVGNKKSKEELDSILEDNQGMGPMVFTQDIIAETQLAAEQLAQIKERDIEIKKLEKGVSELHELFMDLHMLVESQGEMIDNIEKNVTETEDFIVAGNTNLRKAVKFKKKNTKRMIYLIGGTIFVILLVGGVVALIVCL